MAEPRPGLDESRLRSIPVLTPFERSIVDLPSLQCQEENDFNYRPYDLFALKTKILLPIGEILKIPVTIGFETIRLNDRMVMTITAYQGSDFIPFNEEQNRKISKLVDRTIIQRPRHCALIFLDAPTVDLRGRPVPNDFLRNIIPNFELSEELNAIIEDDMLLIDLSDAKEYRIEYDNIQERLSKWLTDAYQNAWVKCDEDFAQDFALMPIESDELLIEDLYEPIWNDTRITVTPKGRYPFLKDRMVEDRILKFELPSDFTSVQIYQIAIGLIENRFKFCVFKDFILVDAYTLEECSLAASIFESGTIIKEAMGIAEFPINTLEKLQIRSESLGNGILRQGRIIPLMNNKYVGVVYPTDDKQRPYTFAVKISYNVSPYALTIEDFIAPKIKGEEQKTEPISSPTIDN